MFNISLLNEDTKTLTLAIKALGNAAHPNSVKQIQRLLPKTSHVCGILEPHVIFDAVMALRKFAKVVPTKARDDIFQFSVFFQLSMCSFINNVIIYKLDKDYCFSTGD